mgnify:CR=1 FL=1
MRRIVRYSVRWLAIVGMMVTLGCVKTTAKVDDAFMQKVANDPFPTATQAGVLNPSANPR